MASIEVRPFNNPNNTNILNAIRKNASADYQRRIPNADKANIADTINNLLSWSPGMNEFQFNLVNLIGMQIFKNSVWTNPLAKFKRGMLQFGDTIEEINNGLLQAHRYNEDAQYLEADIFGSELPDSQASFHKINRKDYYKLSINSTVLRRAFMNEFGLSEFINNLMSTPVTSDNWDEFLSVTSLFKTYHDAGGFFNISVDDVANLTSTSAQSQNMLRRMRGLADNLVFLNTQYNASGMPIAAKREELELFITPEANAAIDVLALAGAFNVDKAEFDARKTIIPAQYFGFSGVQAILTTKDFFVIADSKLETQSAINPVGLHTNYFLHHHEVISASRFVPAILFTSTEAETPIVISSTPVQSIAAPTLVDANGNASTVLLRGSTFQGMDSAVTAPAGGANDAIRYSLTGEQSKRTAIWSNSVITVGIDEASTSITIVATSVDNNSISNSAAFTVEGDKANLWPNPQVDSDNNPVDATFELTPNLPTLKNNKFVVPTQDGALWTETIATGIVLTQTTNAITIPSHGLSVNAPVKFGTITTAVGITAGTQYYVKTVIDANNITVSATVGGAVVAITTSGTAASAILTLTNGQSRTVATGQAVTVAATAGSGWVLATGATASENLTGV